MIYLDEYKRGINDANLQNYRKSFLVIGKYNCSDAF